MAAVAISEKITPSLSPLSSGEIRAVVQIRRTAKNLESGVRFISVTLKEPLKKQVNHGSFLFR